MLLMLKVATFSGSLSVLSAASYAPFHKTQGRDNHYVGDVGAIRKPGCPPIGRLEWAAGLKVQQPPAIPWASEKCKPEL